VLNILEHLPAMALAWPIAPTLRLLFAAVAVIGAHWLHRQRKTTKAEPPGPVVTTEVKQQHYSRPTGLQTSIPFVQLRQDDDTREFLRFARQKKPSRLSRLAFKLSSLVYNRFDVQAMLGRSSMHLITAEQIRTLLAEVSAPLDFHSILDVGAGDGRVSAVALQPLLRSGNSSALFCTETSRGMADKLAERGYTVLRQDLAAATRSSTAGKHELIALFNVLDRCSRPVSLVKEVVSRLTSNGWILLATPLPFRGKHFEGTAQREPAEELPRTPKDTQEWAAHAQWLLHDALPQSLQLRPAVFTRVPYISMGDREHGAYVMTDVVVLCRPMPRRPGSLLA